MRLQQPILEIDHHEAAPPCRGSTGGLVFCVLETADDGLRVLGLNVDRRSASVDTLRDVVNTQLESKLAIARRKN